MARIWYHFISCLCKVQNRYSCKSSFPSRSDSESWTPSILWLPFLNYILQCLSTSGQWKRKDLGGVEKHHIGRILWPSMKGLYITSFHIWLARNMCLFLRTKTGRGYCSLAVFQVLAHLANLCLSKFSGYIDQSEWLWALVWIHSWLSPQTSSSFGI